MLHPPFLGKKRGGKKYWHYLTSPDMISLSCQTLIFIGARQLNVAVFFIDAVTTLPELQDW